MCYPSLDNSLWVRSEFVGVDLGDKRRSKRLEEMAAAMAENPKGCIHGSLPTWAESKAAYRLLDRPEVTHAAVLAQHTACTLARCRECAEVLLIEDTCTLNYNSHPATKGLGRIGDDSSQGLFLHNTLAFAVKDWTANEEPLVMALGLFEQMCWARTMPTIGAGKEKRRDRYNRL